MKKLRQTILVLAVSAILMSVLSGCRITIEPLNSSDKKEESSKPSVIEDIKDTFTKVEPITGPDFLAVTEKYGLQELDVDVYSDTYWDLESITVNDVAGCRGVRKREEGGDEYILMTWTEFNSENLAKAYFDEEVVWAKENGSDYWGGNEEKIEKSHYASYWTEFSRGNKTKDGVKTMNRVQIAWIDNTVVFCYTSQYVKGGEYDIVDDIFKDLGYFWEE